ncbi:hypothetical protein A9Z63_00610 [Moraxella lacunata]|uniref:Uncharacterized protein n=2 Tax=Moraxellaceae TaxID=468 RepID=A0A1B8Q4M8_MORLA|nr:hypothetical protein A9Z63_00610 [Moraxella lacunata]OBX64550.1 hypothetical protein A9309_04505 [Moraxella lacunata]
MVIKYKSHNKKGGIMTTLTFNELIMLVNRTQDNSLPVQTIATQTQSVKPKKRIGLMPIDKQVYEWLDKPIDDLFDDELVP